MTRITSFWNFGGIKFEKWPYAITVVVVIVDTELFTTTYSATAFFSKGRLKLQVQMP